MVPTIDLEELKKLGRRIDSEFIFANNMKEMYLVLNTKYPIEQGWVMLKSPVYREGTLVAFVCKPREE